MDLTRVYQALQNADAAGDTEAAKQLANFIKTQQQADEAESRRLQKEYGPGVVGTFGRAVKRGAGELASTVTDIIPAAIGSVLGFEGYAKEQLEEAAQKRAAREAEAPTLFRSYKEVEGLGDVPRFVSETIGEQVPNILTSLIPGAGVGVAAGRTAATSAAKALTAQAAQRGLVGEAAEQFVAQGLKAAAPQIAQSASRGQVAGLALGSYAQNAPEIFQNIYENTGELAPGAAAIFGAASAALDSVLPAKLLKQLTGPMKAGIVEKVLEKSGMDKGLLRSVTAGALTGVPAEGLTEGMQEAISIYAENFVAKNPQVFDSKEWDRVMESAVKGAVAGGAFGAVGGAGERARAAAERREAYAQSLERRGQRQLAAEVRRQSAEIEAIQAQEPQMQLPGFEAGPAAGLYTPPEPEPKAPKELKGRQAELFTAEGELAPAVAKAATRDEKIEANKQRLAAQREAAQVKEAQAKLKKFLSAKQAELPLGEPIPLQPPVPAPDTTGQFDLFRPSAPAAQAQAEAETLAKTTRPITTPVVTPEVRPVPSLESITKIDDLKAFGKLLGIGPTARILRADGPLAGKDLSNPADAAEVKRTLEAYASGKPAAGAAEKIDTFLKRPEFQGAADVARPVEPPSGAGAGVPSEPAAGAAPGAAEQVEPSGVVPAGAVAEQPAGREVLEPVAVEAAREEAAGVPVEAAAAPAVEEPSAAPVTEAVAEPEPGKKAKADLAKAEKGAEEAVKEQATFAQEVDQRTNDVLMGQLRTAARGAGLTDADVPSESFLGTDIHNALRLPPLLNEFFRLQEVVRQEGGDPAQRRKNAQEMEAVKQEIAKSGMNPDEAIATLVNLNPTQRDKMLSELNRQALNEFAREIKGRMPAFRAKREAQEKAKSKKEAVKSEIEARKAEEQPAFEKLKGSALAKVKAETAQKKLSNALSFVYNDVLQTDEARETFKKDVNKFGPLGAIERVSESLSPEHKEILRNELNFIYGQQLFLPTYQGPAFDDTQRKLAESGDVNGLLRSLLDQIKDPAIKQVLRKLRSLNLKTKLVIGNPEGAVDSPAAFARWFSGSKIVDAKGNPLVMYHGTEKDFSSFDLGRAGINTDYGFYGKGIYFTANPDTAGAYAADSTGANIMPVYLSIKNPYTWPENRPTATSPKESEAIRKELMAAGYDGIVIPYEKGDFKNLEIVAFEPTQIKSATGNVGTYSAETPDIRYASNKAGSYDPATNTITLNPINGMNAHTFIHEAVHAAISNVLASPNHPLTREFEKFFVSIQDRLGAAYGAQDLQEFAAELISNPSFQAVLKSIKTPKSESMFMRVLRSIAEFFGFKGKTALDEGLKFVSDAIDISKDVGPTASEKMFLGMGNFSTVGQIGQAMPRLAGNVVEQTKNTLSNIKEVGVLQAALGMLRLDNLNTLYSKDLPSLQKLIDALELRNGTQEQRIKAVNDNYKKFVDVERKHPAAMSRMSDLAIEARLEEVDLSKAHISKQVPAAAWVRMSATAKQEFLANEKKREAAHKRLMAQFSTLPDDVQNVYRTMRADFDKSLTEYRNIIIKNASPTLAQRLANEFQNLRGVIGYVPFLRHGDFWVEYADPQTGERAASAFESVRERQQFIDSTLKPQGIQHRAYQNLQSISYDSQSIPPTSFIGRVLKDLQDQGADQAQLDSVYQAYLTLFPGESILKQFMKAKNVRGMERDMVRNYGDIMIRWARKLSNSEYMPQINQALGEIATQGEQSGNLQVEEAAKTVLRQGDFFRNPTYSTAVQAATQFSYFEYIAGNISSALINLTSLPLLVWPILSGRFGFGEATAAMFAAQRTAINGMEKDARYKNLYKALMDHGQLEHTLAREVLEGRRQKTSDYQGLYAKLLNGLSIPFSISERYNRGVTAIAAYDLAKNKGMSEADAIRYALDVTKEAHTSGMAATAPRWMQHPIGRVFFTFKSFVWNSAFVVSRAFYNAFKGESRDVRLAAQRQLLGMYGMATVFAGVKGMPFYGAASTMATMLHAMFGDDEPYDFDEEMRRFFGELFYKGFFNYLTNLEVANRAGIATDLIFRDDPRGIAEHGYVLSAMQQAFGPLGSYLVNAERGIKAMNDGHVERGVEALLPSWARNGLKGARYMAEGAVTLKGDPVSEDISAYNSLMQVIGFAPADLSSTYERLSAAKGYEREVNTKRTQLLNRYDMARHAGDSEMMAETRDMIQAFNQQFPVKRITADTLSRSIAARKAAEKQMINGVRFDKKLLPEIREKFFEDED